MIHFFIGTKAQFIKMVPVMIEMKARGIPFRYIDSGQHAELTKSLRKVFGLGEPDLFLGNRSRDVTTIVGAVGWALKLGRPLMAGRKFLRKHVFPGGGLCLIHGDTMSTLFGMRMAKAAGLRIGHVEAGLRSYSFWNPFPEELIRIYCMKRCDLLFAPSAQAYDNLQKLKVRGKIIETQGNTVVDAIRLMEGAPTTVQIPDEPFALATCHRLETLTSRKRLARVVDLLNNVSKQLRLVFVTHKPTRKYLKRYNLYDALMPGIDILDMQDYMNFVALLRAAKVVLTDGGSIQEECAYLRKPCLVIRNRTERSDGLGDTAMLWQFSDDVAEAFLSSSQLSETDLQNRDTKPSSKIVDALAELKDI